MDESESGECDECDWGNGMDECCIIFFYSSFKYRVNTKDRTADGQQLLVLSLGRESHLQDADQYTQEDTYLIHLLVIAV